MTFGRDPLLPAPDQLDDRSRHSGTGRYAGDAAGLPLTFRAKGPAYAAPSAEALADDPYEFHAQSWFDGPGVGGLVEAARNGDWDPLVDPMPNTSSPAGPVVSPAADA